MMNTAVNALSVAFNQTKTQNNANAFKSSNDALVDLFAFGGAMRNHLGSTDIGQLAVKAFLEDKLAALRIMFYLRDIRGGQGERDTFRQMIEAISVLDFKVISKNLHLVSEYGRWDDLIEFYFNPLLKDDVKKIIETQLQEDIINMLANKPISLLGKWMPSVNTSSKETKAKARILCKELGVSEANYRRTLSKLRAHLDILERRMTAKEFDKIDYQHVPSQAMHKHKKAFSRNDGIRFGKYLNEVSSGKKTIKSEALYPYQIIHEMIQTSALSPFYSFHSKNNIGITEDVIQVWNEQWKALPNFITNPEENSIAVVDVSGSMMLVGPITPMAVAVSIGLYLSERAKGPFANKIITFSAEPELVQVCGNNILERAYSIMGSKWGMNTNIEAVFDTILNAAINAKMNPKDMINRIYIVSDMEFDECACNNGKSILGDSLFRQIRNKYTTVGYDMPELVFWRVNVINNQVPMTVDDRGIIMVSGLSPSIFKHLMAGEILDAKTIVNEIVNSERYQAITI